MPHDERTAVARLYERLTEALQRTRRDPFNVPVTVAEIYQELVPYRLVRAEIGFDMNADYEHALLRLLGGEGEWLRIEPPQAAEEIRRELRSGNPNLSIYRNYAACDVWVRRPAARTEPQPGSVADPGRPVREAAAKPLADSAPATERQPPPRTTGGPAPVRPPQDRTRSAQPVTIPAAGAGIAGVGHSAVPGTDRPHDREERDDGGAVTVSPMSEKAKRETASTEAASARPPAKPGPATGAPRPVATPTANPAAPPTPPAAAPPRMPATPAAGPTARSVAPAAKPEAARCAFCDSALPQQRPARFCPYCGADQTTRPCASCGEPLEPGWAFCITCGATAQ